MRVVNYSEFRNNLAENLNAVNENREIVVVSRSKGKNVVIIDLDEYNALQETLHLTSTKTNCNRLEEAIAEMKARKSSKHKLIEKSRWDSSGKPMLGKTISIGRSMILKCFIGSTNLSRTLYVRRSKA